LCVGGIDYPHGKANAIAFIDYTLHFAKNLQLFSSHYHVIFPFLQKKPSIFIGVRKAVIQYRLRTAGHMRKRLSMKQRIETALF